MRGVSAHRRPPLVALVGCGDDETDPPRAVAQQATTTREPGVREPIRPPLRISAREPTQVVGGPLFFRARERDFDGVKEISVFDYVLVFKLNRDPLVFSRTAKNNNHGRGTYGVAGWDISDDGGIDKVPGPGKHCFYGCFPGPLTADIAPTYHRLKPGQPVRVTMHPRKAEPPGRTFKFVTPLLLAGLNLTDRASVRQLRSIGCGVPDLG